MFRPANKKQFFKEKEEEQQNPYIGFTSFQHFRGECLYSDVITDPQNNMLETEPLECFPIPEYVPQKGREEGFYPDTSIAYIRLLWKEFEPKQGEYHYEILEDILAKAKACGQTVMFRLIPHSTRAEDDVPDWLKDIIPCPARPAGKRVKDSPKDPRYFAFYAKAVQKIAERFDKDPTLDIVDICMPGAWGESYKLEEYTEEELKQWIDLFTHAFHNTILLGQAPVAHLIPYANKSGLTGWRGDGLGGSWHMQARYPHVWEQIPDMWETAPVSFESLWWLGEWKRKGWDIDDIIEKSLQWHISSFNAKSLPIPNEWTEKIKYWISKMGYHFVIDYFNYPEAASASDTLAFEISIENVGVAPIYRKHDLRLRISGDEKNYEFNIDADIRKWLPGKHAHRFCVTLPDDITPGKYQLEIGIGDDNSPIIYLCTDAKRKGRFYSLGDMDVI